MSDRDIYRETPALLERIRHAPSEQREAIVATMQRVAEHGRLDLALHALFRQQVAAGYVLFDPSDPTRLEEKQLPSDGGATFRLQWNPLRELRLDHALLLARGVIAGDVDPRRLVNRDAHGNPCYLCRENIAIQSPGEVVFPVALGGACYFLGANFAPITNNHFTVVSERHRPQRYHQGVLHAGFALGRRTGGRFRALFNGLAGASILGHEHLHATDVRLPVETLVGSDMVYRDGGGQLAAPPYPLPLWLIEGNDVDAVVRLGHRLITAWHHADQQRHSENLLMTVDRDRYRLFIMPRDLTRLTARGRRAAMGSFEAAGLIVLSHEHERPLFESADRETVEKMLADLAPAHPPGDVLREVLQLNLGF